MAVIGISGKQFTFSAGATPTDHSARVTSGGITKSSSSTTVQTLGGSITQTEGVECSVSCDFLFDEESGFYDALETAIESGDDIQVTITGGGAEWTGSLKVTDLSTSFDAGSLATCSASFAGAMTFGAATP